MRCIIDMNSVESYAANIIFMLAERGRSVVRKCTILQNDITQTSAVKRRAKFLFKVANFKISFVIKSTVLQMSITKNRAGNANSLQI